ncbi:MAG: ribose-phosphate diphosphokinase [Rubrivivax sp.]|nr:ribose-phosphate diphosphokinase [Rubrivivax sp.]
MSLVLAFADEAALATALAAALGVPLALIDEHRFPDSESRLRLPPLLPHHVILLRGLQQPNDKLATLWLAAAGARELGAGRLTLVAPYLAYMRQDMAFAPGEVVSQRHLGALLATQFDRVITVDPHLHRVATLDDVLPGRSGLALSAAALLGAHVVRQVPGALLLAPDEEAGQWVRAAAAANGLEYAVCHKRRRGDHDVAVALPDHDVAGRAVVILDDVASTGRTLMAAARGALAAGAASVDVAVTHALFIGDAWAQVRASGVRQVWSSNCVPHPSNAVDVVPLIAAVLRDGPATAQRQR